MRVLQLTGPKQLAWHEAPTPSLASDVAAIVHPIADVTPLPDILTRCWELHESVGSPMDLTEMIYRGEYLKKRLLLDMRISSRSSAIWQAAN